ncbi:cilia- and flagella-associated protein 91 [Corythoichthys intestinalis]|uniref:cilia- and flagella-associated protein 91 n=1 Tax=Corythoichthys intestinalis TaxID=161448 RepID=UPI0025A5AE3D|nr:cilia- and flagella-associated protein 91 [Corythoichthys intestinalis]XP_061799764.1 cilia- and flagella-associated protein 91-like [Nerophis lumbriciformis]
MATVTRTMPKPTDAYVVKRERLYDYLYEPVYYVSSEVDHDKSGLKTFKEQLKKMPEFETMFSNERVIFKLDPSDPVQLSVDCRWRGNAEQRQQALQQLIGFIPSVQPLMKKRDECQPGGADRWKFFKRPLPCVQQIPLDVNREASQKEELEATSKNAAADILTHLTVAVQTDYRESEVQTDPYTPDWVLRAGTSPSELLVVASFTWNRGLPASIEEVEMIQRSRARRAWEARLPALNDPDLLRKRRRMMEEMEAREWAFREGKIQKLQHARLALLGEMLLQKDQAQVAVAKDRLSIIYSKLLKEKESKLHKVDKEHMRSMRKLETKRRNMEENIKQLGTCKDYTVYSSLTCAARECGEDFVGKKKYSNDFQKVQTYDGLLNGLQRPRAAYLKQLKKLSKAKPYSSKGNIRSPDDRRNFLLDKYKNLKDEIAKYLVKKEKPAPRPVTPTVEEPPEGEEERELAVIHLQKLLRGRCIQTQIFTGKENHLDLIKELRMAHALRAEEQQMQKADKKMVMALKEERDKIQLERSRKEAQHTGAIGAELEYVFDTLSKELIRLQEERRIHAFTLLAERERLRREAEESGRRQAEERHRLEDDQIFREVVKVHQETVDLYFEDIILDTMEVTADQQAREEIRRVAKEVNDIAYAIEESRNNLQSEEIVSELVYGFLIPEVEKNIVRQRVHERQRRHLLAVRSIVEGNAEVQVVASTMGTQQVTRPSDVAAQKFLDDMLDDGSDKVE